jgi:hypothetical protein
VRTVAIRQLFVLAAAVGGCVAHDEPEVQRTYASITLAPRQLRVMTWNVGFMEIHLEGNGIPIEIQTFVER